MPFYDLSKIEPREIADGVHIRAPWGKNMMLSMVELSPQSEVPIHNHPHEQGGVVVEGRMSMTIGDETRILEPGDVYLVPPNIPHGASAVEGRVRALDVFAPVREDYRKLWSGEPETED